MQPDLEEGNEGYSSKLKQAATHEVHLGGQRELIGLYRKDGKIITDHHSPRTLEDQGEQIPDESKKDI